MIEDPNRLAGLTTGEGCFFLITKSPTHYTGFLVKLVFILTQHARDEKLMRSLINFLVPLSGQGGGDLRAPFMGTPPPAGMRKIL